LDAIGNKRRQYSALHRSWSDFSVGGQQASFPVKAIPVELDQPIRYMAFTLLQNRPPYLYGIALTGPESAARDARTEGAKTTDYGRKKHPGWNLKIETLAR